MTDKPKLMEHDAMVCRSCGNEERASEGYPCADCGYFHLSHLPIPWRHALQDV